jgi:hypothetical protein
VRGFLVDTYVLDELLGELADRNLFGLALALCSGGLTLGQLLPSGIAAFVDTGAPFDRLATGFVDSVGAGAR